MITYIVCTDSPVVSGGQPAKLYKLEDFRKDKAIHAASGTVSQMQEIADRLNGE